MNKGVKTSDSLLQLLSTVGSLAFCEICGFATPVEQPCRSVKPCRNQCGCSRPLAGYKSQDLFTFGGIAIPSITVVSKATFIGINRRFTGGFDLCKLQTIGLSLFITSFFISERFFFECTQDVSDHTIYRTSKRRSDSPIIRPHDLCGFTQD